jgi:hypothetical protein
VQQWLHACRSPTVTTILPTSDGGSEHRDFGDVTSNLPIAVIGLWGLAFLAGRGTGPAFSDPRERRPYVLVFFGLLLTALRSSAYYHLAPDNARLVRDRLPMTVVCMAPVAAMIAERVSVALGLWLLPPLLTGCCQRAAMVLE